MEHKNILILILFISPIFLTNRAKGDAIFDIRKYGANPKNDISQALVKAWKDAIASPNPSKVYIPPGIWKLSQVVLSGTGGNKAPIEFRVEGTVQAYSDVQKLPDKKTDWINFRYLNHFTVTGGGVFDGNGQAAWKLNDCKKNKNCIRLPMNLGFSFLNNSMIQDVTTKDSKNFHVNCLACYNVTFLRFTVSAPDQSPNTDGIHLAHSAQVNILSSTIQTGDDCVSISSDVSQVNIRDVTCGPGHGISIGSLGGYADEKDVTGIYVTNCTFIGTDNGARVKTWPSGPATLQISDLRFEDLTMVNVRNPIIIEQDYCPPKNCDLTKSSGIKIRKVSIKNIRGTTTTAEAMTLKCSASRPCEDVKIGDVNLKYVGKVGTTITTVCDNVKPIFSGKQVPRVCANVKPHVSLYESPHHCD